MSSTSFAVISDSMSPTRAMASAYGATVVSVSRVKGTSGSPGTGSACGSSPLSPTVGTAMPAATVTTVRTTMDTSGAGTTLVILGKSTISTSPATTSGYTGQGTSVISGTCAMKMRMARALTKPVITERGTNRINLATPSVPRTIWKTPARMTAATRYPSPCSRFNGAITRATAPVAAEIIARRPPTTEMVTAMVNAANSPISGSTPAMIEKEIASGTRARATTSPARTSVRHAFGSEIQSGLRPRRRAAGESAGADKREVPVVVGHARRRGTCGGARGPGRSCARAASRRTRSRARGGVPTGGRSSGAERHGGQTAALGVIGMRSLSPAWRRYGTRRLYPNVTVESGRRDGGRTDDEEGARVNGGHMRIGEVASRTELSLRTIRHYEETGLVVPSARSQGGFRLYTEADVARLMVVRRMKPLGFTLDEMRDLLEATDRLDRAEGQLSAGEREQLLERVRVFERAARQRVADLRTRLARAEEFAATLADRIESATAGP
ncbi:hypothetical protein STENM327S_08804 [Streptomyces tendae]